MEHRGWRVSLDKPNELVAAHRLGPVGATFGNPAQMEEEFPMVERLTLVFLAVSIARTDCTANIVACLYGKQRSPDGQRTIQRVILYKNEDSTKDIQDILAEARKRLKLQHPEYAAN